MNKKKRLVLKKHRRNKARLKRIKLEALAHRTAAAKEPESTPEAAKPAKTKKAKATKSPVKKAIKKAGPKATAKSKAD